MDDLRDAHSLHAPARRDSAIVVAVYAAAIVVGVAVAVAAPEGPVLRLLAGSVAATVLVWVASAWTANASMYDAYWSVGPAVMAVALLLAGFSAGTIADPLRATLAVLGVLLWAARLTANWYRGWGGLAHEDWRYERIRLRTGVFWQPVNLLGIHLMPTGMTWAGTLPLVPVLLAPARTFGPIDVAAALVLGLGIWFEWRADADLHAFRRRRRDASELLDAGLWARCRHPNYLGEMLFWWGLAGFALAADPAHWPWAAGAAAITALFLGVSIPLIETRLEERKPGYAAYRARVPMLLPYGRPPD